VAKTLNGELENNSKKPRDLVKKWHSDSKKRFEFLFLGVRRRRKMMLLMMKTMMR
jgi:hypothetical protein